MNTYNNSAVWENIEAVREARNISKKRLSELTSIPAMSVSRHTNGDVDISTATVIKYAEALGCSPADFFEGTVDRTKFSAVADLIHTYPYNLACTIMGYNKETTDAEKWDIAYNTYVPGLMEAMGVLNEQEKKVIEYRFKSLMTLAEIGKELGLSGERIRQIKEKAIRRLRHPSQARKWNIRYILPYLDKEQEYRKTAEENEALRALVKEYEEKISAMDGTENLMKADPCPEMDVDELDLSVRSFNCLSICGIKKVKAITMLSMDDLMCIRNLGKKSAMEIEDTLNGLGMELCADGKQSKGTVGALRFRNERYRPYAMVALRSAGIFTMKELSHITKSGLSEIINKAQDSVISFYNWDAVSTEIVKAAARQGIRIR